MMPLDGALGGGGGDASSVVGGIGVGLGAAATGGGGISSSSSSGGLGGGGGFRIGGDGGSSSSSSIGGAGGWFAQPPQQPPPLPPPFSSGGLPIPPPTPSSSSSSSSTLPTAPTHQHAPAPPPRQPLSRRNRPPKPSAAAAASTAVVAAICRSTGFASANRDALDLLAELFSSYMSDLVRRTTALANGANRAEPNIGDIKVVLERMGVTPNALAAYKSRAERANLPSLAIEPPPDVIPSEQEFRTKEFKCESTPWLRPYYIPPYFPEYPCVHTYKSTEITGLAEEDPAKLREIRAIRALQVEANLRRLLLARERHLGTKMGTVNYTLQRRNKKGAAGGRTIDRGIYG
ncbi:hypothetical protein DFJ73DRAFT_793765 [Zopfochytrium polystomum]|nr:hypothetical protein DFJ73DRAFT_793765 [Zopfochytrium polystomum]